MTEWWNIERPIVEILLFLENIDKEIFAVFSALRLIKKFEFQYWQYKIFVQHSETVSRIFDDDSHWSDFNQFITSINIELEDFQGAVEIIDREHDLISFKVFRQLSILSRTLVLEHELITRLNENFNIEL